MPRPLQVIRRRPDDSTDPLALLSLDEVLQRLAALNPDKLRAIDQLARIALHDELDVYHD